MNAVEDEYRDLLTRRDSNKKTGERKDKLAETKKAEQDIKAALKAQQREAKEKKKETTLQNAAKFKAERLLDGSTNKRASKDAREAARRESRKETGQQCEHGIWRCAICFPKEYTGKVSYKDRAPVEIF